MQIYNSHLLNNKQRFQKAILFSLLAAIGCAIICGLLVRTTRITFSIYYVFIGYVIAKVISDTGHGVGKKFSYLGAGMTLLSIILTQVFISVGFDIILQPNLWLSAMRMIINSWSNFGYQNIMSLLFIAGGIYVGYTNASI